jgi:hypothetical protein
VDAVSVAIQITVCLGAEVFIEKVFNGLLHVFQAGDSAAGNSAFPVPEIQYVLKSVEVTFGGLRRKPKPL